MTFRIAALLPGIALFGLTPAFVWSADLPATQPVNAPSAATQPAAVSIDPSVQALVDQLADPSPAAREKANKKLEEMGKSILPQLESLAGADDPETRARVQELIRRLHRRTPPVAPRSGGNFQSQSVSSRTGADGARTIDVSENGRKIHIEDRAGKSIRMTVSGVDENGREATEKYEAKDADELKHDNPEAYALYDKWGNQGHAGIRLEIRNGPGRLIVPRKDAAPANPAPVDPMGEARERIRREIQAGNLPADMQQKLLERLDDMEKRHAELMERMKQLDEIDKTEKAPVPKAKPAPPPVVEDPAIEKV